MKKRKKRSHLSGQVLLETAIVIISLAVIAISSMALFSSLNLNLIDRMDLFKNSRRQALNSIGAGLPGNALDPTTYLDYSPNKEVLVPSEGGGSGYFDPVFFEDPRVRQAEVLLDEADNIINTLIPYQINYIYNNLLGGSNNSYRYIYRNITKTKVTKARNICNDLILDGQKAYNNFFGPAGAIALLEDVLNHPEEPGPFDFREVNAGNRLSLQGTINSLKSLQAGLNESLNNQFLPRIRDVRNLLNNALAVWDVRSGWGRYYQRYNNIIAAKNKLKEIIDFMGEVKNAVVSSALATNITTTNSLLQGDVTNAETIRAKALLQAMLSDAEVNSPDAAGLKNFIQGALSDLNSALFDWDNIDTRLHFIDLARGKMGVLNDIAQNR